MKDKNAVEIFLRERVAAAVEPRTRFAIGSFEDECFCLVSEDQRWLVGFVERGKFSPEATFSNPISAAKYLILLILDRRGGFDFPGVDWSGYASLPDY